MKSLSIVIPIYNGENFIENCVESITTQNNGKIEIVIVNDGSTDNTSLICAMLAEKYSFVKYYEKANGGVSSARNFALDVITGEYVWFVDADDSIANGAIKEIFKTQSDLAVFNFLQLSRTNEKAVNLVVEDYVYALNGFDGFFKDYVFRYKLNNALWNKVFKTSIIKKNNLAFNESIKIGEDYLFSLCYYKHIKEIYFSTTSIYQYYINEGGAMKSKNKDVFVYQEKIADVVKNVYKDNLHQKVIQQFLLMQLICGINQSQERGVDSRQIKQYVKNYMKEIMEEKRFSREVVKQFLKSEGVGLLSKLKFKWRYRKIYR